MTPDAPPPIENLATMIGRLDHAVEHCASSTTTCNQVKNILEAWLRPELVALDPTLLAPRAECYARRLLHRDPRGRYSVVVMVWDKGQGTPIHDHAGMWCVECVYEGRIQVDSYELEGAPEDELVTFRATQTVMAGRGEAGSLIPPFDYHVIKNANSTPAITVHVYGGDMTWCHGYYPTADGRHRRERKPLNFAQ